MSPERIRLEQSPSGARVVPGGLEALWEERARARAELAWEAGRAEAEAGAVRALEEAVSRLDEEREGDRQELARTAVLLALEIARQLLRREVPRGGYDLEAIVREALAAADVGRGPCTVRLNPEDADRVQNVAFRSGTRVEPDPGVPCGSVQIDTPRGLLVRDLDEALRDIGERLLSSLS